MGLLLPTIVLVDAASDNMNPFHQVSKVFVHSGQSKYKTVVGYLLLIMAAFFLGAPASVIWIFGGCIHILLVGLPFYWMTSILLEMRWHLIGVKTSKFVGFGLFVTSLSPLLFLVSIFTLPILLPYLAFHGFRSMRRHELRMVAAICVAIACGATLVFACFAPDGALLVTIMAATVLLVASAPLSICLTTDFLAIGGEETAASKPPAFLVWFCLFPLCPLPLVAACFILPAGVLLGKLGGSDLEWKEIKIMLVNWFALVLLPQELLLNILFGPACALRAHLVQAGEPKTARWFFWAVLPFAPVVWCLALGTWLFFASFRLLLLLSHAVCCCRVHHQPE